MFDRTTTRDIYTKVPGVPERPSHPHPKQTQHRHAWRERPDRYDATAQDLLYVRILP